jgi:hypothetical protein
LGPDPAAASVLRAVCAVAFVTHTHTLHTYCIIAHVSNRHMPHTVPETTRTVPHTHTHTLDAHTHTHARTHALRRSYNAVDTSTQPLTAAPRTHTDTRRTHTHHTLMHHTHARTHARAQAFYDAVDTRKAAHEKRNVKTPTNFLCHGISES